MSRRRPAWYILDEHGQVVPVDKTVWVRYVMRSGQHLRRTRIGNMVVSTIFLGIPFAYSKDEPLLFETAIWDCDRNECNVSRRYTTLAEAEAGHAELVLWVKEGITLWRECGDA